MKICLPFLLFIFVCRVGLALEETQKYKDSATSCSKIKLQP